MKINPGVVQGNEILFSNQPSKALKTLEPFIQIIDSPSWHQQQGAILQGLRRKPHRLTGDETVIIREEFVLEKKLPIDLLASLGIVIPECSTVYKQDMPADFPCIPNHLTLPELPRAQDIQHRFNRFRLNGSDPLDGRYQSFGVHTHENK
jgi:hypothetical protein